MKLKVIIHHAEEGGFWAEVPALQGCYSQGETLEEVKANIKESIDGWLAVAETTADVDASCVAEVEV